MNTVVTSRFRLSAATTVPFFRWGLYTYFDDDDQRDPLDSLDHRITGHLNFDVFGSLNSSICFSSFYVSTTYGPGFLFYHLFGLFQTVLQALRSIVSPLLSRSLHFSPS